MVWRRALHGIATNLSVQYNSVYATFLGANPTQLGSLHSVGNAVGAFVSVPAGWIIDTYSIRGIFLLSTVLLAGSSLLYFLAPHWAWLFAAIILYYLGMRTTCTSCTVVCARELPNEERATGRGLCRTLSSFVVVITPLLAAWFVSSFGGMSTDGIRPLYAIQFLIFLIIFVLLLTKLRDQRTFPGSRKQGGILAGFAQVFNQGSDVVRLIIVMALMELPWSMTQPFMPVYAHQFKGADEFILSGIAVAITIVPMITSIPLGRLADRYGRKKFLFIIAPLAYAANLFLVFAPVDGRYTSLFLLIYGVFFGFNSVSMILASSMTAEIMPSALMGRWIGIVSLIRALMSIPMPLIGGLIWDHIGPEYVFAAAVVIDVVFRLPLLGSVRETLSNSTFASQGD
jgi:ACS family glucarate transporter-like MFS transporter